MRLVATLAVVVLAAGCGIPSFNAPDWITNRQPLPSCGEEIVVGGDGTNEAARRCMLTAFVEGTGAEMISTVTTVEGDPVVRYIRVHENGTVELFIDASRDQHSASNWQRLRCEALVPVAEINDPPDLVFPESDIFVEDGCEPQPLP